MASYDLSGKVAVITGASSGIGRATAVLFAQRGASLVLCGRDQSRLKAVVDQCTDVSSGIKSRFVAVLGDVNDSGIRQTILEKTIHTFERMNILVTSAGVWHGEDGISVATEAIFDTIFNTNVKSTFFMIQNALPYLEKSGGNVVNVSSVSGTLVLNQRALYPMSKAAVDHMTRCLALDLAPRGIRVNAVNPSFIPTNILRVYGDDAQEVATIVAIKEGPRHPLNRRCVAIEDVAEAIAFLASDSAKSITGQCLLVDSGRQFMGGQYDIWPTH